MRYVFLVAALLVSCPAALSAQPPVDIGLSQVLLPDSGRFFGTKTLTFKRAAPTPAGWPAEWNDVESAAIVENPALKPVTLLRYKGPEGVTGYALQTDPGKTFDTSSVLHFRAAGERSIADRKIDITSAGKPDAKPAVAAVQVVLSRDRVLARLAECREGTLRVGDRAYALRVYALSVDNPFYVLAPEAACLVDLNRDGGLTPAWRLDSTSGQVIAAEKVTLTSPFIVGAAKFTATGLDSAGTRLTLETYQGDTCAVAGFKAPDVSFLTTSGTTSRLGAMRGKVVLITFWSTTCGYCERIRPALNSLVEACPPSRFQAIDAALDSDLRGLMTYLQSEPYAGMIVPYDAGLWQTYNRRRTTPVFILIDQEGTLQLSGSGASLFAVVDRLTRNLLQMP